LSIANLHHFSLFFAGSSLESERKKERRKVDEGKMFFLALVSEHATGGRLTAK
jgi:hypothetical protein